jgi:predicted O-methyltransferase YrrM
MARTLFPFLLTERASSTVESCEFQSLKTYEADYRRLARILGRDEGCLPAGEIDFLESVENRRAHPGTIGLRDYLFLSAFASILAPERAVEIGTLAGFSAAIIAAALHRRASDPKGVLVETIDKNSHCVAEHEKQVGFQIADLIPDFPNAVRVHAPAESEVIEEFAVPSELQFVFIDANHQHPQPLLDLLRTAPYVHGGGWILLHDIKLGTLGRANFESDQNVRRGASFGAEWLFEYWPFGKIAGGNIGAVQIPVQKSAIIPAALRLMALPFEMNVSSHAIVQRQLYQSFATLARRLR